MGKIAIAGGSGGLASEVIDGLAATGKHEILLLSRQNASDKQLQPGVSWHTVDYEKPDELAETLQGVDTVLSFIVAHLDINCLSQKNLIKASIKAGVRRFAPSEWMTYKLDYMSWYANKEVIRGHLREINKDKKVLEYCLFQPGYFMDYLAAPYKTAKHIHQQQTFVDFDGRQALLVEGDDDARIVFTTVKDIVQVVVRAVDYQGEWPVTGGIQGQELSVAQLLELGKKIRGRDFAVERLSAAELKAGEFNVKGWQPKIDHPSIPPEQLEVMARMANSSFLLAVGAGAFQVSNEWNRLLPDYEFTSVEIFLSGVFKDKP